VLSGSWKIASITLIESSVDIPHKRHATNKVYFSYFFFSSYHNTKVRKATSTGSVRDIEEDAIAVGKAPLLRFPVA
jgi:hypothetical protein